MEIRESQPNPEQEQMHDTDMLKHRAKEKIDIARRQVTRNMHKDDERYKMDLLREMKANLPIHTVEQSTQPENSLAYSQEAHKASEGSEASTRIEAEYRTPPEGWKGKQKEQVQRYKYASMDEFVFSSYTPMTAEETLGMFASRVGTDLFMRKADIAHDQRREVSGKPEKSLGPNIEASNPRLAQQYQMLLPSPHFQHLDQLANSHQKLTLIDSSASKKMYDFSSIYDPVGHRILVDLKDKKGNPRPFEDVRKDLMIELHNACSRDSFQRTATLFPKGLDKKASPDEKESHSYKMAKFALSSEWNEWINIFECSQRIQNINADLNMQDVRITNPYERHFAKADQGWYQFPNYLQDQILQKHTAHFDSMAHRPDWIGKRLMAVADPASLMITQEQVENWKSGKTTKIKPLSNNPW
ncbi:hypothetical protein ccbrp13_28900 [Ktedonobacteria bacterium brp13]|nr:hypothetical protein ccbrp13_28900 [Ktedonobacteria bacterium brp13]